MGTNPYLRGAEDLEEQRPFQMASPTTGSAGGRGGSMPGIEDAYLD